MRLFRNDNDILYIGYRNNIKKMIDKYKDIFNEKPQLMYNSLLEKGDHSELGVLYILDSSKK